LASHHDAEVFGSLHDLSSRIYQFQVPGGILDRYRGDASATQACHASEFTLGHHLYRLGAKAASQGTVEGGWRTAALQVSQYGYADVHLQALFDLFGNILADAAQPLDGMAFVRLTGHYPTATQRKSPLGGNDDAEVTATRGSLMNG